METAIYNLQGQEAGKINLPATFETRVSPALLHEVVVGYMANRRSGTHATKTRAEVSGGGRKPWREKGTGNARAGSNRSPLWRKGGIIFGPKPRDYYQEMPRKMRQMALRCVLSAKASSGELKVVEEIKLDKPKTKDMVKILTALGVQKSAVIALVDPQASVIKSARNLGGIKTVPASLLSVYDLLSHDTLLMTEDAVRRAEQLWGKAGKEESSASV